MFPSDITFAMLDLYLLYFFSRPHSNVENFEEFEQILLFDSGSCKASGYSKLIHGSLGAPEYVKPGENITPNFFV